MEEQQLSLALTPTDCGSSDWPVNLAEAPFEARVVLDDEHDQFEWVTLHRRRAAVPARSGRPVH